jgi:hypothetical protein
MGCACNKNRTGARAAADSPTFDPALFPNVDSAGPWKVYSSGGAAYRFSTLAEAKQAAELIDGRIVSV